MNQELSKTERELRNHLIILPQRLLYLLKKHLSRDISPANCRRLNVTECLNKKGIDHDRWKSVFLTCHFHQLIRSSWKKSFDDREDNSSEKADEGIEQPQVEQTDQDKESIRLDAGEKIAGLSRSETHQDF